MRLSWSHKLFLRINRQLGRRPALDALMRFAAHRLLYIVIGGVAIWALFLWRENSLRGIFFGTLVCLSFFLTYLISYALALLFPHRRPVEEFQHVRQLFASLGTWKSFPSDHTIAATVLPIVVAVAGGPAWFVSILALSGFGVALGRVYAGVHYPRDIIGGFAIGLGGSLLAIFYLLYR